MGYIGSHLELSQQMTATCCPLMDSSIISFFFLSMVSFGQLRPNTETTLIPLKFLSDYKQRLRSEVLKLRFSTRLLEI